MKQMKFDQYYQFINNCTEPITVKMTQSDLSNFRPDLILFMFNHATNPETIFEIRGFSDQKTLIHMFPILWHVSHWKYILLPEMREYTMQTTRELINGEISAKTKQNIKQNDWSKRINKYKKILSI